MEAERKKSSGRSSHGEGDAAESPGSAIVEEIGGEEDEVAGTSASRQQDVSHSTAPAVRRGLVVYRGLG
uniref:Uncharacterized protein n=1 Tax=Oryza barthii TaxID=65489 RepID=A0A0D3F554_9ORYZ